MSDPFSLRSGSKADAHQSYVNNLRAAEVGDETAMKDLGVMFATGDGVPKDYDEARRWFEKAAAAGNDDSMVHLAVLCANGWSVPRDYAEARRWLEKSADLGNDEALFRLGELYRKGLGVSPDLGEARRYYEKAAAAGNEDAKKALKGLEQPRAHETQSDETQLAWFESTASQNVKRCSLPECPCPGDGVEIPVGQGYLYIPRSCCEFRWDCRSMDELATKVERRQQNSQYVWIPGHGIVAPILVCELGAKKLGIDLAVAARDAKHWWATSQVPLRPTPRIGEPETPFAKPGSGREEKSAQQELRPRQSGVQKRKSIATKGARFFGLPDEAKLTISDGSLKALELLILFELNNPDLMNTRVNVRELITKCAKHTTPAISISEADMEILDVALLAWFESHRAFSPTRDSAMVATDFRGRGASPDKQVSDQTRAKDDEFAVKRSWRLTFTWGVLGAAILLGAYSLVNNQHTIWASIVGLSGAVCLTSAFRGMTAVCIQCNSMFSRVMLNKFSCPRCYTYYEVRRRHLVPVPPDYIAGKPYFRMPTNRLKDPSAWRMPWPGRCCVCGTSTASVFTYTSPPQEVSRDWLGRVTHRYYKFEVNCCSKHQDGIEFGSEHVEFRSYAYFRDFWALNGHGQGNVTEFDNLLGVS